MPPDVMPRRRRVMPRREMPRHPSVITLDGDITPMAWCHAACYHAPLAWRHAKTAFEMPLSRLTTLYRSLKVP